MSQFFKLFPSVLTETNNLIQSSIIALIVSKAKGKNECVAQKTWIAKKLCLTARTITNNIKALEQMGLIQTETTCIAVNGEPKTTTHFTITEKLQELIGAEESNEQTQPSKPSNHCQSKGNEKPIERPHKPIAKKNDDVDLYNYDLFLPIIMKQNERRGEVC